MNVYHCSDPNAMHLPDWLKASKAAAGQLEQEDPVQKFKESQEPFFAPFCPPGKPNKW